MAKAATKTQLESEAIAEQIAEVEGRIAELEQQQCEIDKQAADLVHDEDQYLEACDRSGEIGRRVDACRSRIKSLEKRRLAAVGVERRERIEVLNVELRDAARARDAYSTEVPDLKRAAERKHKLALAEIGLKYHELDKVKNAIESELGELEADECEEQLRSASDDDRPRLQADWERNRQLHVNRGQCSGHAASAANACRRILDGEHHLALPPL